MTTLNERFAAGLLAGGETEVPSKSRKYRTFTRRKGGFYFVGKSGALRFGATSSRSLPVNSKIKQLILEQGK